MHPEAVGYVFNKGPRKPAPEKQDELRKIRGIFFQRISRQEERCCRQAINTETVKLAAIMIAAVAHIIIEIHNTGFKRLQ
jgi:hypothetical protein